MKYVIAADARFQRHFNSVVHWIMWTCSVSKGFIRYSLLSAGAVSLLVDTEVFDGKQFHWLTLVWRLSVAMIIVAAATYWRKIDDNAHASGRFGIGDQPSRPMMKIFWCICLAADALLIVIPMHRLVRDTIVSTSLTPISAVCFLFVEYLYNTPPFPPERREKKLVQATEAA
jgi:hypothetical protein